MSRKILVVDASLTVRRQVLSILNQAGFTVMEADRADNALGSLAEHKFTAILSGLDLKVTQSGNIHAEIERFQQPGTPLILMFANDRDVHFCDWLTRVKVAGCVQKPISEENLMAVVNRVLSST